LNIRIAGIVPESVVDGPGIRFVIFTQGCPHRCPGCHNKHTWNPDDGYDISISELLEKVNAVGLIRGVTFSGGEPFIQAAALAELGRELRKLGKDIVTFTGYTWEELMKFAGKYNSVKELVEVSDYIIDGRFVESERDLSLPFRGSRNQRIIDVKKSLRENRVVEVDFA